MIARLVLAAAGLVVLIALGCSPAVNQATTADPPPPLVVEFISRVDEMYVDPPDFAALARSALKGLIAALGTGSFRFREEKDSIQLEYAAPGTPLRKRRVPIPRNAADAIRVLGVAFASIEEIAPLSRGLFLERAAMSAALRDLDNDSNLLEPGTTRTDGIAGLALSTESLGNRMFYLRPPAFHEDVPGQLQTALARLTDLGMEGVVFDLRGNAGGLLTVAIEIAEQFMPDGQLVVYTESRIRTQNMRFSSHARTAYGTVPLVVLVNRDTAAGAEIVASALQDWKRAILVGTATRGDGSIKTPLQLSDGSILNLKTARWFSPRGKTLRGQGLQPDIVFGDPSIIDPRAARLDPAADPQVKAALTKLQSLKGQRPEGDPDPGICPPGTRWMGKGCVSL